MKVSYCNVCNYWSNNWKGCSQCGRTPDERKYLPEPGDVLVQKPDLNATPNEKEERKQQ